LYKDKIKKYNFKLSKGQAYIEVNCNHAQIINDLEVRVASMKNELRVDRETLKRLEKDGDKEL
jgi:hypothetical protein